MTREAFVAASSSDGASEQVAGHVWDLVSQYVAVPGFSPHPDDDYQDVYMIADDDMDDDIATVCRLVGLPPSTPNLNRTGRNVRTLRDVIGLISACPPPTEPVS